MSKTKLVVDVAVAVFFVVVCFCFFFFFFGKGKCQTLGSVGRQFERETKTIQIFLLR